jgi:paraquat-inducible protein B
VQLLGSGIGQVTEAHLQYDDATDSMRTRVTLQLDPSRVEIAHRRSGPATDPVAAFSARIEKLVARGLRAQLTTANFLTGIKVISLDLVRDAPPARIEQVDGYAQLPSGSSSDIADILASVKSIVHHVDTVTAGPELGHAVKELDRTLTNLDHVTAEIEPQIKPLIDTLRETSEATQRTLQAATNMLGSSAASGTDLPRMIRELTDAARSIRALTDYLEQHPDALIRGRRGDTQ